jgi:hypothetical protein
MDAFNFVTKSVDLQDWAGPIQPRQFVAVRAEPARDQGSVRSAHVLNTSVYSLISYCVIGLSKKAGGASRRATILRFIFKRFSWIRPDGIRAAVAEPATQTAKSWRGGSPK